MYKVFNMGHRMEIYCQPKRAEEVVTIANEFDIDAQIIGRTEASENGNKLSLSHLSEIFEFTL